MPFSPELHLIEECAELQKALCKAERFGWDKFHPRHPDRTNGQHVEDEIEDVLSAISRVVVRFDTKMSWIRTPNV